MSDDSPASFTPTIIHLPGTRLTPDVVLHRTLTKLPRIKSVVVLIQWDDGSVDMDWSQMKKSELTYAAAVMQVHVMKEVTDTGE